MAQHTFSLMLRNVANDPFVSTDPSNPASLPGPWIRDRSPHLPQRTSPLLG